MSDASTPHCTLSLSMPPKKHTPSKNRYHKPTGGTPSAPKRTPDSRVASASTAANAATAPAHQGNGEGPTAPQPTATPAAPPARLFEPSHLLAQDHEAQTEGTSCQYPPLFAPTDKSQTPVLLLSRPLRARKGEKEIIGYTYIWYVPALRGLANLPRRPTSRNLRLMLKLELGFALRRR